MKSIFENILNEASKHRFLKPLYNTYSASVQNCPSFDELLNYIDTVNVSLDWQSKDKEKLFNQIVSQYIQYKQKGGSLKDRKQDAKNIFLGKSTTNKPGQAWGYDFFLHDDLETDKYIFLSVLSYDAAHFCDSFECGGEGAKWCIGYEKTDEYWNNYVDDDKYLFVLAFNKAEYANKNRNKNKLKFMLALSPDDESKAWVQSDEEELCILASEWKHKFGRSFNEILKSIDKAGVISAVHFSKDELGEFYTDSPWIKVSLFSNDTVCEDMYKSEVDEASKITYVNTVKETGFIKFYDEIIIDGEDNELSSSMIYNYEGDNDILDLPTLLDYIAKHTKPVLNNDLYNKKLNSLIIKNANIRKLVWEPEATHNNVKYVELQNCQVDTLEWVDYSSGDYNLEFDDSSSLTKIRWGCSPDTFYSMSSSNLKLNGIEPLEEYADEDYEEDEN